MNLQSMPQMAAKLFKPRVAQAMLAALLMSTCGTAMAQDYQFSTDTLGFTSISGSGTDVTGTESTGNQDDGLIELTVPFDIQYFGQTITMGSTIQLCNNGFIRMNNTGTTSPFSNSTLTSSTAPNDCIFVGWEDLDTRTSGSFFHETQAVQGGGQVWLIEFSMIPFRSSSDILDAQVAIFDTGVIEIRYSASTVFASNDALTGLKDSTGLLARGTPGTSELTAAPTENFVFTPFAGNPDVTVGNIAFSNPAPEVGDSVTAVVDVTNAGAGDAGMFELELYLSTDSTIDSNDQLLGTATVSGVIGSQTAPTAVTFTVPMPNPVGMNGRSYFVGAILDSAAVLVEADTTNNTGSAGILIGAEPYVVTTEPRSTFATIVNDANTVVLADNTATGTTTEITESLPFDFDYFGMTMASGTPVAIGYSGWMELGDTSIGTGSTSNSSIPRTSTSSPAINQLFPFWDSSGISSGSPAQILKLESMSGGNRVWTIEWHRMSRLGNSDSLSFQVILEENANTIRFRYDEGPGAASTFFSATVGLQTTGGGEFIELLTGTSNDLPAENYIITPSGSVSTGVDLTAPTVSVTQTSVNAANSIDVSLTLANTGASPSGAFNYTVYLSDDITIEASDTVLSMEMSSGVAAGGMSTETFNFPIPTNTTPGLYYVGVIVDAANVVAEDRDNNNVGVQATAITVNPPGRDEGDLNDDDAVNVMDVMFCINFALNDDTNVMGDLNGDNSVNVLDIQITINRVLNAP